MGKATYQQILKEVAKHRGVRVRRWRKSMSGAAWQVTWPDGRINRYVECPLPKSELSLAIFLHEVGHHVIGFSTYKMRCEEEHHAWAWAVAEMHRLGVPVTARVQQRVEASMRYAVSKAQKRGCKSLPVAVQPYAKAA